MADPVGGSTRMTAGGFPYSQHPHEYCGTDAERQSIGDPGHCEDCCSVGHIVAHPDLGCGDVGCVRDHPEVGGSTPTPATERMAVEVTVLVDVPADITETQMRTRALEVRDEISVDYSVAAFEPPYWLV